MSPNLLPGDRVITFNWVNVKKGDIAVFKTDRNYIKRVVDIKNGLVYVAGDNKTKSAKMKPVAKGKIAGKVIWKY